MATRGNRPAEAASPSRISSLRVRSLMRSPRAVSWPDGVEILEEHAAQLLAILFPMSSRGIIVQPRDPVHVQLVNRRIDAIALQQSLPQRPRVAKRLVGAPLGKPRVLPEQRLEHFHPS